MEGIVIWNGIRYQYYLGGSAFKHGGVGEEENTSF